MTSPQRAVVLSRSWGRPYDEMSFAVREVAGALSRLASVDVVVPGTGATRGDGAFDLVAAGPAPGVHDWPLEPDAPARRQRAAYAAAIVEEGDLEASAYASRWLHDTPTFSVGRPPGSRSDGGPTLLDVGVPQPGELPRCVGLFVAVHPSVSRWRYLGEGADYVLVLSDRSRGAPGARVSPLASTIVRRFPHRRVVVVENGFASYWRLRVRLVQAALRTRTDLWRLISHASVTVDLAPGHLVARECVESLRYGVPIVVPAGTAGAELAEAGGGLTYGDDRQLAAQLRVTADPRVRARLSRDGRALAERWYGDPEGFVGRMSEVLGRALGPA